MPLPWSAQTCTVTILVICIHLDCGGFSIHLRRLGACLRMCIYSGLLGSVQGVNLLSCVASPCASKLCECLRRVDTGSVMRLREPMVFAVIRCVRRSVSYNYDTVLIFISPKQRYLSLAASVALPLVSVLALFATTRTAQIPVRVEMLVDYHHCWGRVGARSSAKPRKC